MLDGITVHSKLLLGREGPQQNLEYASSFDLSKLIQKLTPKRPECSLTP